MSLQSKIYVTPLANFLTTTLKKREFHSNWNFYLIILAQKTMIIYHEHSTIIWALRHKDNFPNGKASNATLPYHTATGLYDTFDS